jgi:creatinine amidohydrolase
MSFGDTATLDNATFAALIESVVCSVLRHGFGIRRIVLLNAHGGNEKALRCPDLVASERISLAKANTTPHLSNIVGGGVNRWRTIGSRSASGVIGNPRPHRQKRARRCLMQSPPPWPTSYVIRTYGNCRGPRRH